MRTAYLNAILFFLLIAAFFGIQYGLANNYTNWESYVWFKLSAFVFMIPLVYSGGTLFAPSFIKYPYHIIGAIDVVAIIAAVSLRDFSIAYILRFIVALTLGTILACFIARILRHNSLKYKNKLKKRDEI